FGQERPRGTVAWALPEGESHFTGGEPLEGAAQRLGDDRVLDVAPERAAGDDDLVRHQGRRRLAQEQRADDPAVAQPVAQRDGDGAAERIGKALRNLRLGETEEGGI